MLRVVCLMWACTLSTGLGGFAVAFVRAQTDHHPALSTLSDWVWTCLVVLPGAWVGMWAIKGAIDDIRPAQPTAGAQQQGGGDA